MAENMQVNDSAGAAKSIAADDIGGVLHQRVKIVLGSDGENDGDVAQMNPIPVGFDLMIRNLFNILANPTYLNKSVNALQTIISSGTVTTVTGLTNIDGYQGKLLIINQNNSAWASVVRSRIS